MRPRPTLRTEITRPSTSSPSGKTVIASHSGDWISVARRGSPGFELEEAIGSVKRTQKDLPAGMRLQWEEASGASGKDKSSEKMVSATNQENIFVMFIPTSICILCSTQDNVNRAHKIDRVSLRARKSGHKRVLSPFVWTCEVRQTAEFVCLFSSEITSLVPLRS